MSTSKTWRIDGMALDTIDVSDAFTMAIAQHKIPYRRGATLENMGLDDRSIKLRCVFMEERYADHTPFIEKMTATQEDSHELDHPEWGILFGSVVSVVATYDDTDQVVNVDFTFVVEADVKPESYVFLPTTVASVVEDNYAALQSGQMEKLAADMEDEIGSEASEIVTQEIDPDQTLLEQFLSASVAARAYIAEIDAAIALCEATLADVEITTSSYINTVDFGTGLPGRLVGAMARVCERFCHSGAATADSPRSWLASLESAYAGFLALFSNGLFSAADQMQYSQAVRYSLETSYQYAEDNDKALTLKTVEQEIPFDVLGRRISTVDAPEIMTINELDETLYVTRTLLQRCVDLNRGEAWTYKRMADALFQHVQTTRLQRHRIVTVSLETPAPMHLVCFRNGLPVGMADRVLSLNPQIKNANQVTGEVRLYAA